MFAETARIPGANESSVQDVPLSPKSDQQLHCSGSSSDATVDSNDSSSSSTREQQEMQKSKAVDSSSLTISTPQGVPQDTAVSHPISRANTVVHFDPQEAGGNVMNMTTELFPPQTPHHQQQPSMPASVTYTLNLGPTLTLSPAHARTQDKCNQTSSLPARDVYSPGPMTKEHHQEEMPRTVVGTQSVATSLPSFTSSSHPSPGPTGHVHSQPIIGSRFASVPVVPQPNTAIHLATPTTEVTSAPPPFTSAPPSFPSAGVDVLQESIASIVRSEVKATLQEQHAELLNMLKAREPVDPGHKRKKGKLPILTSTKIHDSKNELPPFPETSDDFSISSCEKISVDRVPKVLNLDELKSSGDSEFLLSSAKPPTAAGFHLSGRDFPPGNSLPAPAASIRVNKKQRSDRKAKEEHKVSLMDVEVDGNQSSPDDTYSTSTSESGVKKIVKKVKDGIKAKTKQWKKDGVGRKSEVMEETRVRKNAMERRQAWGGDRRAVPLLETSSSELSTESRTDPSLEDVFPEVVNNLRKFESSVRPAWRNAKNQASSNAGCSTEGTGLTFPIFRLPQMAASLPGTANAGDQDGVAILQSSKQNQRGDLPPPLLFQVPSYQQPPSSLHRTSPVVTGPQYLSGQHSSLAFQPPPPPPVSFCQPPHDVKFPLLLPQDLLAGPNMPPHQDTSTRPHLPLVMSSSIPLSVPSQAPPTNSVSHMHTRIQHSQLAPPPPPPQLFHVPGLFSSGVLASLLVPPEQLLEQQRELLNTVSVPRQLKVDHHVAKKTSKQTDRISPVEKPKLPLKMEASDGCSETSAAMTSSGESITDVDRSVITSVSGPSPHLQKKLNTGTSKRVRKKKPKTQESLCSTSDERSTIDNDAGSSESGKEQIEVVSVKDGEGEDVSHSDQTTAEEDDEDDDRSLPKLNSATGHRVQSESEKKMKQMLENAEKLSGKLKTSGELELGGVVTTWAEPSGDMIDLPDRLQPLASLEVRRLNLYKIDPELKPSGKRKGEGNKTSMKKNAKDDLLPLSMKKRLKRSKKDEKEVHAVKSNSPPEDVSWRTGRESSASDSVKLSSSSIVSDSLPPPPQQDNSASDLDYTTVSSMSSSTLVPEDVDDEHLSGSASPRQITKVIHSESSHVSVAPPTLQSPLTHSTSSQTVDQLQQARSRPSLQPEPPSPDTQHSLNLESSKTSLKPSRLSSQADGREVPRLPSLQLLPVSSPRKVGVLDSPHSTETLDYSSSEPDGFVEGAGYPGDSKYSSAAGIPDFRIPTHSSQDRLEHESLSVEMLLREMRSGSSRKEAMESFMQLEDQLRALHKSVRAMDGGFKQSNKILKTIDHLTEASGVEGVGQDGTDAGYRHLDNVSVSSDGRHSCDSHDAHQVATLYREFKRRIREGGELSEEEEETGGGRDGVWMQLHDDEEGSVDEEVKGATPPTDFERQKREGYSREGSSAMVLHRGQRWDKEELRTWVESKRRAPELVLGGLETNRDDKKESDRKKQKLEPQSPRKLKCSKSFLEEARLKRLEDAHILMADIINSQKTNIPKSFPHPRQSAGKPPTLQNTFTISHNPVSGTTAGRTKGRDSTSKSSGPAYGMRRRGHSQGQAGRPILGAPVSNKPALKDTAVNTGLDVSADTLAADGTKRKPRVSFEKQGVDYESSVASESVMSNIDWDEVDRILDS